MLNEKLQQLEAGAIIELIEVDGTEFGADILRFHAYPIHPEQDQHGEWFTPTIAHEGKEYHPFPYEIKGLAQQSNKAPTPTLSLSNINNTISALCLMYQNMLGAKVTITTTTVEHINTVDQYKRSIWYIEEKANENNEVVSFKLSSPADVGGLRVPSRVMTTHCTWALRGGYRGADCGYTGAAKFDLDDNPTDDPALDQCAGLLRSCRKRFESVEQPLRFGGYPTIGMIRN